MVRQRHYVGFLGVVGLVAASVSIAGFSRAGPRPAADDAPLLAAQGAGGSGNRASDLAAARAANNTALEALSGGGHPTAIREGFAASGDAPPVLYVASASPCPLNSGSGDGGSQVPTHDGGCWLARFGAFADVREWGAIGDDSTDSAAKLNAAVVAADSGGYRLVGGGLTYKADSVIAAAVDVSKTSLNYMGLDFAGVVNPSPSSAPYPALRLTTTHADCNSQAGADSRNPFIGVSYVGPSYPEDVDLFEYVPTTAGCEGLPYITGVRMISGGVAGFRTVIVAGGGLVDDSWTDMTIASNLGHRTGTVIELIGETNSCENVIFDDDFIVNLTTFVHDKIQNPNCEIDAYGTSVDGVDYVLTGGSTPGAGQAATVLGFFGGHLEHDGGGISPIIWAEGALIDGATIVSIRRNSTFCESDGPSGAGLRGITMRDVSMVQSDAPEVAYFCAGGNPFVASGIKEYGDTNLVLSAPTANLVPDFRLQSASSLGGGSVSAASSTCRSLPCTPTVTVKTTGNPALGWSAGAPRLYDTRHLPVSSTPRALGDIRLTHAESVSYTVPIKPGEMCWARAWVSTAPGGGGRLYSDVSYLDASGEAPSGWDIGGVTWSAGAAYARRQLDTKNTAAPAGAAACKVTFTNLINASDAWIALPEIYIQ